MDIVNVNIVSVLSRVIGEVTAVRDALNTVGTQPTDNQQLKAEIAAIADSVEDYTTTGADAGTIACIVRDLRQLSAV
jgi:hypothetical protein